MNLIFLGTGPANPIPRHGCRCDACNDARAGGKSRRTRSAALLQVYDSTLLIDAGPDIAEQLSDENIKEINGVVLTHGHSDAAFGLARLNAWLGRKNLTNIPLWTDDKTKARLVRKFKNLDNLKFQTLIPFQPIRLGKLRVTPFPVHHAKDFATFGFAFGKRLVYASDVSDIPSQSHYLVRGVKNLILDGAMYLGKRMMSHLSADQSIKIARVLGVSRLILTQIGHSYPPHRVALREVSSYVKRQRIAKPSPVALAFDGMRINF